MLTVGDPLNPGIMYYSNVNNPDGAADSNYIEITGPTEPTVNGFYAEGSNWVFTSTSLYRVESTLGAVNPYTAYRVSGVEGLAGPWAFDAQRNVLFFWGPDAIYMYAYGAAAQNMTQADLYPLFPHGGQPGLPISIASHTFYPPSYTFVNNMRITYSEGFVYATYIDANGDLFTLTYGMDAKGWNRYQYTPRITLFVLEKGVANPTMMMGGYDGNLYQPSATATADAGGAISWYMLTPAKDAGDSRALKQFGDVMFDYMSTTGPTAEILYNNLFTGGPSFTLPPSPTRQQIVMDLVTPPQLGDISVINLNIALFISGTGPVSLFEWQPSFLPLPEQTTARVGDWQIGFSPGFKWVNGVVIHGDTQGVPKQFVVEYDNQQHTDPFTVTHNGEQRLPYYFPPIYAHELRLVPLDDVPVRDWHDEQWIGNAEPEYGGAAAYNWMDCGTRHYKYIQGFRLHFDTFGLDKLIQIQYDGGAFGPTLTVNANGEQVIPYSWNPPFKAHLVRIVPLDNIPWRIWPIPDPDWVYEIEPEPANYWISQPTALGQQGWTHCREMYLAFAGATAGGVVSVVVDGQLTVLATLPASVVPKKQYFTLPPLKGLYWQLSWSGTGLQVYTNDTEFLVKSWGSTGPYNRLRPFGDISGGGGQTGARI